MKIIQKPLKGNFKEESFRVIIIAGLTFGLLANILSHLSSLISTAVSWSLPLVAIILGYYKIKAVEEVRSFSHRLSLVIRGSVLFVLASALSSLLVNAIAITLGEGWGLSGVNMITVAGTVSLILGVIIGLLAQSVIFSLFGIIGGMIAGNSNNEGGISPR